MSTSPKTLILVDGSSYLYRAFHAMPALTNSKGRPTGAAYGITNMLKRVLAQHAPDFMAVVFDAKGKTFRDTLYPQYKANRPSMPEELRGQVDAIYDIVRALGIPLLSIPGVEADDVIGTLSRQAASAGMRVMMSTSDKDMAQLVDEQVTMVNTMDDAALDPDGVLQKFGVPPQRIIDYLALIGDKVDNVPGVPNVGPKTAVKWLETYGDLEGVLEHADEIKGKVGENLRGVADRLPLSKTLVTIACDVDVGVRPEDLTLSQPDIPALHALYADLEFKTWLAEILDGDDAPGSAGPERARYEMVLEIDVLDRWLRRLAEAGEFAFDTETTALDYMVADLVGVSFSVAEGEAAYVPLAHVYEGARPQIPIDQALERLRPVLENPAIGKIGQNLKYDMSVLARHGIAMAGIRYDTMLESYVLDSTATRHDMDSLALKYLGYSTISFEDVAGKGRNQLRFDQVPLESATTYAAEDADITLRLHRTIWPRLEAQPPLCKLFREIEMPLIPVLSHIERTGVKVDAVALAALSAEFGERLQELEAQAHSTAGRPFNLGSPKQLQEILFDEMGLPVLSKTPKGQPSTAESVLQELAQDHALPHLILEHRALSKLRSTYTDALPMCINPSTGRVHTSYHQAVASTGRLSSSDPNLQNIPVRREEGRRIRQTFVAEPGYRLLAADYSQIELRIMAHLSGDEGLRSAFEHGDDVHRATAAEVFGVDAAQVTADQRRNAKAINFGLIYGMSAFGLGRQLGIERSEAQRYVDLYFARYPGVKDYMDRTREGAAERGYVETVFGRRLYVPEINSRNAQRRQYAERTAINAPMQGTAADIIKRAMIGVYRWLAESGFDARMIMQVHDELVFEVREGEEEALAKRVRALMSAAAELAVELEVDVGVGSNWDEAH